MKYYKLAQENNYYTIEIAKNTKDPEILKKILERGNDDWVSRWAAENPNCPPEALADVLKRGGDDWVSYYAAKNPNCPPEVLTEVLKRGKNDKVSQSSALNINCPPEALAEVLQRGNNDYVSYCSARNVNCPPEVLTEVLKRGNNDEVSWNAALNKNCPPEVLADVLKRVNNDEVSQYAAGNPNCPPQAKIKWMRNTGKIGKEDPTKHILQYDLNEKEEKTDEDLEKLKKLISFNLKNYKLAQEDNYYTEKIARITQDPEILKKILERGNDDWISCVAAENINCPPEALEMVLKRGKDDDVSWYASQNINCPPEALADVLKRGKDDAVSQYAARNLSCPPEALEMVLKRGKNDIVSCYSARSPNCTPEILTDVLKRGKDDAVSWHAALNKNCPPEVLADVLKRGKDDEVSYYVAMNLNCPPQAKIKWMRSTGRIGKEDPTKHIIQYDLNEKEEKPDEDLEKLRRLIGKNYNWYKTAIENYYNLENAINTKDPEILKKILEKGNDDVVSCYAAQNISCPPEALSDVLKRGNDDPVSQIAAINTNCPPEALEMVLKRGKNDYVSYYAAENINCPPEILTEILKRGNDDGVSYYAAKNPNCPPEALETVLKRGKDDYVSYYAAMNLNCPPQIKIRWMKNTGKIGKEDPTKHIIEYEEEKPDEDLEKLKKLMGFNLKKYKLAQNKPTLFIMRGISGSGKSTLAKQLGKNGVVLSADDYFMVNEKYMFDPDKISDAHEWNQNNARKAMQQKINPIVIDDTNLRAWEASPYVKMAKEFGYNVEIKEPNTSWKWNAEELFKRNKHDVPKETIKEMIEKYEPYTIEEAIISEMPSKENL